MPRFNQLNTPAKIAAAAVVLAATVFGLVVGVTALFSFSRTDGGTATVIRNGGPFDSTDIRQVLPPNSPLTFAGLFSSDHPYPAGPRFYDIVPGGDDQPGVNAYRTPTFDGVDVGVTARINFTLNTDPDVLSAFDDRFGIRTYAAPDGQRYSPWQGDTGFAVWLDAILKPIIEETLRQQIGSVDCADLQASCALVQNSTPEQLAAAAEAADTTNNAQVIQAIQTAVQDALATNVNRALGGQFLTGINFSLTGVDLPAPIRDAIVSAQTAFAGASQAQAALSRARIEADAQTERQRGYNACSTCAEIDRITAEGEALSRLPASVQVYAPGSDATIAVGPR